MSGTQPAAAYGPDPISTPLATTSSNCARSNASAARSISGTRRPGAGLRMLDTLENDVDDQVRINRAVFKARWGKATLVSKVEVTTPGLIAIGALVSSILASTAGLVWVSTSVARERPVLTALRRR